MKNFNEKKTYYKSLIDRNIFDHSDNIEIKVNILPT